MDGKGLFKRFRHASRIAIVVLLAGVALALAGCGSVTTRTETAAEAGAIPKAHPQAIDPVAGQQAQPVLT